MIVTGFSHLRFGKICILLSQINYLDTYLTRDYWYPQTIIILYFYTNVVQHCCHLRGLSTAQTISGQKYLPWLSGQEKKMSLPHQPSSIFFQWPGLAKQTSTEVSLRRFSWAVLYSKHQSMKVGRKASIILFLFKKFAKVPFAPWFVAVRGS